MLKQGILNPTLNRILSETGHTELLTLCDKGFPVPTGPERLDLALVDDIPKMMDVLKVVSEQFIIDRIFIAEEMKNVSQEYHDFLIKEFSDYQFEYVSHLYFKEIATESRAVIRTGETIPYSNMIIVSG
ncbi:D-ribose pyranase [Peribacillus sp. NPDC097225]|uniref:D-ribose pyranase n=1 Tax=Peribacillus sp. NPDC097225 TaxID=3364400 RepID=UPI00380D18DB